MKNSLTFTVAPIANGFLVHTSKHQDRHIGLQPGQAVSEPVYVASPAEAGKFIADAVKAEATRQAAVDAAHEVLNSPR